MGTFVRPFNYRFDGTFARGSEAWFTHDDGLIEHVDVDERRIVVRPGNEPWIWMEGARENFIQVPENTNDAAWDQPASGTSVEDTPDGQATQIGTMLATEVINQTFLVGSNGSLVTWSIYVKTQGGGGLVYPNIVNGIPSSTIDHEANEVLWTRAVRKAISLAGAGNKLAQLETDPDLFTWGGIVEAGPGYAQNARFPSQPILITGSRSADSLIAGAITTEMVEAQAGIVSYRITFEPEFDSADVVLGDVFRLVIADTGVAATSIVIWLEGTGAGAVRARAGIPTGTFASSGPLTFFAGNRITLMFTLATGSLTVLGVLGGGGTFSNGSFTAAPASVLIGGLTTTSAYSLVGPFEIGYDGWSVESIDQLTLNSIKVSFADFRGPVDVLQFNPRGVTDALNPANYEITGTPGLPHVQYVQPGDVGSEVVLFFDDTINPGALVKVSPRDIVLAGSVPVPMESGARAIVDMLGYTFGRSGGDLTTVFEVVKRGELGNNARLEMVWWNSADPKPGDYGLGVVITDPNPDSPYITYYFRTNETTLDMEQAVEFIAGHLVRVKYPGVPRTLNGGDVYVLEFQDGQDAVVLSLIAFGDEVNAVAQAQATYPRVDIANPQTDKDTPQGASLGTFQVTDAGDLVNDHGRAYLRKRIYRRLATFKSGFFHMPDYGLNPASKKLFTPTTLRRLQMDVEIQVRQEPGVLAARASVAEVRPGVVAVKLRIQDDNGSFELEGALDFTAE